MQQIGFLLFPGFQIMSLAAVSAFEFANLELGEKAYDIHYLSETGGPIANSLGMIIETEAFGDPDFDTLIVAGAPDIRLPSQAEADFIRAALPATRRLASICTGAFLLAAAGLLDGKRATTHWYSLSELRQKHPTIRYVADRRYVVDRNVATTTGITASMPMMLTLIEAIAGRDKAEAVAHDLGLDHWDARHDSGAFKFTRPFALTAIGNTLAFFNHEQLGIALMPSMDEVSLALTADAWSRTFRSRAVTFAAKDGVVVSRNGIRILPDHVASDWPADRKVSAMADTPPAKALDRTLENITARYGARTTDFVAMQLEYPRTQAAR